MNPHRTIEAEDGAQTAAPTPRSARGDRGGLTRAERRAGYLFWGVVIGVILLVELAGALGGWLEKHIGVHVPWTTISGMVGHLEDLWPTTAVIVVAVLAPAAFYALAPIGPPSEFGPFSRSSSGRWYVGRAKSDEPEREVWRWGYTPILVFIICLVAAGLAIWLLDDDFQRAYVIYGTLFLFGILVPSLLVLAHFRVGFPSLFVTIEDLREQRDVKAVLATVALSAGLAVLVIHLAFYPWPDITKAPVQYAGLTANEARSKANREVRKLRTGAPSLVYSTQARGVVNAHEAWVVFFTSSGGADSGCVVTLTDKTVETTEQCSA